MSAKFLIQPSLCLGMTLLFAGGSVTAAPPVHYDEYVGHAYDPGTGELLYHEHNRFELEGDQLVSGVVTYTDADDQEFAKRTLDFRPSRALPNFHTLMSNTGFEESLTRQGDKLLISFRENSAATVRSKRLRPPQPGAADAGMVFYVIDNLQRLVAGEKLVFRQVAPSYMGTLKFAVSRDADARFQGRDCWVLRIDIGGMLIGMFVDPMYLSFEQSSGRLLRYQGLSNLRLPNGDTWPVDIHYPVPAATD